MPYNPLYTDYPANQPRPDAPGNVSWTQSLLIQNYAADLPIAIDKEIKGGLHRVKYLSQLYNYNYDGIFQSRRAKGMLVYVEFKDDDTPLGKYYSLKLLPGTSADQWVEVGSGTIVTLNNPKTVANLDERDALETVALAGTATTGAGTTNVNGTGTNWAGADAEIAVGDKFRFGLTDYYFVESILNEGSLKTTTATNAHTNEIIYKVVVQPGDFVNVIDARTDVELEVTDPESPLYVEPYPASFIWDGVKWLNIYPYGENPYSHVQNTDTGLVFSDGFKSADTIWAAIIDTTKHKTYNDATDLDAAAGGAGNEAFTSKKIATELLKRPEVDKVNGSTTLFLNEKGQWIAPSGSGTGGGGGLTPDDIADSETIDFYLDEETGKYKFDVIPVGITIIESTYADLVALIAANSGAGDLLIGGYYSIVYQNKHKVADMPVADVLIWEHPVTEHLVLRAVSTNKFATECFSLEYPTDIINYDINKNICEDNITPRDGFITYRKDTILNNESEGFCFRSTVFPRYTSVVPEYDPLKEYNYSSVVKVTANNAIYIYRHITHFTGKPVTDDAYWGKVCNIDDDLLWPYTGSGLDDFNRNLYQYAFMHPGGGKGNPGDSGWPYTVYKVDINTTPKLFLCFTAHRADSTEYNPDPSLSKFGYHNWKGTGCVIKNAARGVNANNVIIATGMNTNKSNDGTNFKNIVLDNSYITTIWTLQEINLFVGKGSAKNYFYSDNHSDNYIGASCHNNFCGSYFVRNNWVGSYIDQNICLRLYADNFVMGYHEDSIFTGYTQGNVFGVFSGKLSWGPNNFANTVYGSRGSVGHRMHSISNFSGNTVAAPLPDVYVGRDCAYNKFMGEMNNCVLGDSVQKNVFNGLISNSGTFAIPLRIDSSVINQKWNNVQALDTSITVARTVFNAVLDPYTFTVSVADKVLPEVGGTVYRSGGVIDFVASYTEFGTEILPVNVNITLNATGAVVGNIVQLTHDGVTAPTVGGYDIGVDTGVFHKTSGSFVSGVKNYFIFDYRSSSRINYIIYQ